MTRILIAAPLLPRYLSAGWTLVYECAGGLRVRGPAAVVEWRGPNPEYPE